MSLWYLVHQRTRSISSLQANPTLLCFQTGLHNLWQNLQQGICFYDTIPSIWFCHSWWHDEIHFSTKTIRSFLFPHSLWERKNCPHKTSQLSGQPFFINHMLPVFWCIDNMFHSIFFEVLNQFKVVIWCSSLKYICIPITTNFSQPFRNFNTVVRKKVKMKWFCRVSAWIKPFRTSRLCTTKSLCGSLVWMYPRETTSLSYNQPEYLLRSQQTTKESHSRERNTFLTSWAAQCPVFQSPEHMH